MVANCLHFQGQPVKNTVCLLGVPFDSLGHKQLLKPRSSFSDTKWYLGTEDNRPLISQGLNQHPQNTPVGQERAYEKQVICVFGTVFNKC